ncbi:MAG: DUF4126 domain-containing protein [Gemmatimonadetes bacterium]|uniref:DUF4126 domain-containing protein n=1 Tax=Candidatus Kutchimonas denitrificans TaxID=3056748 RepID=A0AAE4ZAP9_9BACT|nr:DUF4126 domain-containing protein [Gemmatimonadota bacterium]NIR76474.1 DUF4126 domain-containing protein [Candidatus Kutchimonas denitrificans]NIS03292.1 DUF4126 domain-containing protein [Gemmatimonadota bacterium]NIT69153.1 DUF4126 domain-containing protein [Gemmatimonadota bacterium]NIU54545.1 DUF4126 family protein [Gemmatimonadota bacterium]
MNLETGLLLTTFAASAAIGLSLYAALAVPGALAYFGLIVLPAGLSGVARPLVWLTAALLLGVEVAACRFRVSDLAWNVLHTAVRPLGGTLFAAAALAEMPPRLQWWGAAAGALVALLVHVSVLAVRAARRTAGPTPATRGFTGIQIGVAAVLATLAWTAPPFAASTAALLVLAPLPWSPRLWGAAWMAISAVGQAVVRPDRMHRWVNGVGPVSRRTQRLLTAELGDAMDTARSTPATLARLGRRWPYLRGRLVVASRRPPLFAHARGFRSRVIRLEPGPGSVDHGVLLETVEVAARTPYTLCLGPDAPPGPAILAAIEVARDSAVELDRAPGVKKSS